MAGELISFNGQFLRPAQEWADLPMLPVGDGGESIEALRIELGTASDLVVSARRFALVGGLVYSFGVALAQNGRDWMLDVPAGLSTEGVCIESQWARGALASAGGVWQERMAAGDHLVFERGRGWPVETVAAGKIARREAQKGLDQALAGIASIPGAR